MKRTAPKSSSRGSRQTNADGGAKARRQSIGDIVTEEAIRDIQGRLNRLFHEVYVSLPPPDSETEEKRREDSLRSGAMRTLFGALVYLEHHQPAVVRALVHAGKLLAEDRIHGRKGQFIGKHSVNPL